MEVTNRFKGLDLIDRVPEEFLMEVHNIIQEAVIKTIPKKNKFREENIYTTMCKINSWWEVAL